MSARAAVVVTGTEVLTGRVADRNGPWLAEQLRRLGIDIAQVIVVGDRPDDLRASLTFLRGLDLVITSGGLGPTADDLTAQVVADHQGRPMQLDPELERRIAAIVDRLSASRGWRPDPAATAAGTRKQAMVPAGAAVLPPTGTAPGLVVPPAPGRDGPPVVVLPGPPGELRAMWPDVLADPTVRSLLAGTSEIRQRTLRLWGTPESELAATLREHQASLDGLEITTCLRDGELEIVTRYPPDRQNSYDGFRQLIESAYPVTLFSSDGRTIDELVAAALTRAGLSIATAESCTGGLLAGRLTALPGSSRYLRGGLIAYADEAKQQLLDVPAALLGEHGAVSEEVAEAMASGARRRFGADIGVGITGIAGPGGATPTKPVGLVHIWVGGEGSGRHRVLQLPGSREDVRRRTVEAALHLIHRQIHRQLG
ncbi:MAG TPA: competence/damage-inducible protein A [Jatrophihabitans sp.]|nr:competence/damage-inducible protein A [Jatrophihabitans sp.]